MQLRQEIAQWDGKSADDIAAIYERYHQQADFIDNILSLLSDCACQSGATWLLKKHLESGASLGPGQTTLVHQSLDKLENWQSRLHLLQSFSYLPVAPAQKRCVEKYLRSNLDDTNKFVRAWAYSSFYEFARQYPEFQQEAAQFIEMAMRDEAPSVKARLRNISQTGA